MDFFIAKEFNKYYFSLRFKAIIHSLVPFFAIKLKVFLFFMLHGTNRVKCSEKNKNMQAHEDNYEPN